MSRADKAAYERQWRGNNAERVRQQKARHYKKHREVILERVRLYTEANREKINEARRVSRRNSPEKNRERARLYQEENGDQIRKRSRDRYRKNRDEILEKQSVYREANREKINARNRERSAACGQAARQKANKRRRDWRKKNRDSNAESQRRYREKNREKKREYTRRIRALNRASLSVSQNDQEASRRTERPKCLACAGLEALRDKSFRVVTSATFPNQLVGNPAWICQPCFGAALTEELRLKKEKAAVWAKIKSLSSRLKETRKRIDGLPS